MPLLEGLIENSWVEQRNWLPDSQVTELREWAQAARHRGDFRAAGIGRAADKQAEVRGDEILWIQPDQGASLQKIWQAFEGLRLQLNQELYLGIDHFELHFAVYPPGRAYAAHIDQARGSHLLSGERVVSAVLYLNPDWQMVDAGELIILESDQPKIESARVMPLGGTLVLFRSDTILHEVRAPERERWSLTGWFRRR